MYPEVAYPILEVWSSEYYCIMFLDSNQITHYVTCDGDYDGYSHDPCVDPETGQNLN